MQTLFKKGIHSLKILTTTLKQQHSTPTFHHRKLKSYISERLLTLFFPKSWRTKYNILSNRELQLQTGQPSDNGASLLDPGWAWCQLSFQHVSMCLLKHLLCIHSWDAWLPLHNCLITPIVSFYRGFVYIELMDHSSNPISSSLIYLVFMCLNGVLSGIKGIIQASDDFPGGKKRKYPY